MCYGRISLSFVTWVEPELWYQQLPSFVAASAALLTDRHDRVLLVQTHHRDYWSWPGGMVDDGETPDQTVTRELAEELGLVVKPGALLVLEWTPIRGKRPKPLVQFIFDSGTVEDPDTVRILDTEEIADLGWFEPSEAIHILNPATKHRLHAALQARSTGQCRYIVT
jgi:8-oxo-dGTP diphosphatase